MTFRAGAAGSTMSARARADHLMEQTLPQQAADLARYYQRGMELPPEHQDAAAAHADLTAKGYLDFGEALEEIVAAATEPERLRAEIAAVPLQDRAAAVLGMLVGQDRLRFAEAHDALMWAEVRAGRADGMQEEQAARERMTGLLSTWAAQASGLKAEARLAPAQDRVMTITRALAGGEPSVGEPRRDMDPRLAELLGLDPNRAVLRTELASILSGQRADGTDIPGRQQAASSDQKARISYYDLCFSADKSVSLAWAFARTEAERNAIAQAQRDAVDAALAHIDAELAQARRGRGGRDGYERGHIGWIRFDHYTARPTVAIGRLDENGQPVTELVTIKVAGDPDLHTHTAVPNVVLTGSGRVGSVHWRRMNGRIKEFGAYYQAHLAQNLRRLGCAVKLDGKTGAARLTGIPEHVRDAFSKRTRDAERDARAYAAECGKDWDRMNPDEKVALLKNGAFRSRVAKADDLSDLQTWRRQAQALGWRHAGVMGKVVPGPALDEERRLNVAYAAAQPFLQAEFSRRAVIEFNDLRACAARGLVASGVAGPQDIDRVVAAFEARGIRQDGMTGQIIGGLEGEQLRATTHIHRGREKRLVRLAREAAADRTGALPLETIRAVAANSKLNFEDEHGRAQLEVMERLGTGGRLAVAIGAAGSGKTALLSPLVAAWQGRGDRVYGLALAWRQADDLAASGIAGPDRFALSVFLDAAAAAGRVTLDGKAVIVVDELGLVGTRQFGQLLELRERTGARIVALGDDRQCQSIEAGPIMELLRRALGEEQIPVLGSTIRQQSKRERAIAGLFAEGKAEEALALKREDGTVTVVPGGYREAVEHVARLWQERRAANAQDPGYRLSISAPTNADAREIGMAIRRLRQASGELGRDQIRLPAVDQLGNGFELPLAVGDRVRLFRVTRGRTGPRQGGVIGHNGSVLDVLDINEAGLRLRNAHGTVADVKWDALADRDTGRIALSYGYALTVDSAQGVTSTEHIDAMPAGSGALNGFKAYVAESRHRRASYLVTSDGAERAQITDRRPLGDPRPITGADVWANMAANLSRQPAKESALAFLERAVLMRRGAVGGMQRGFQPGEQRWVDGQTRTVLHERLGLRRERQAVSRMAERIREGVARSGAFLRRLADVTFAIERRREKSRDTGIEI